MNKAENLLKIGDAVLTPEAIKFIEFLQDENNSSLTGFRQTLLEGINSAHLLLNYPESFPEKHIKKARENLTELSLLYYDLEKLSKP